MDVRYAGYPSVFVFDAPGGGKKIQHLLWGDWIGVNGEDGDWLQVHSRGCDGWVRKRDVQENQLLEVNFVDIGQGDGCFMVTPDDKFILIDAGQGDNMFRFLRWRFSLKKDPARKIRFDTAIMSHPDSDHYKGFEPLFDSRHFEFRTLYHNGILEQQGEDVAGLGNVDPSKKYLLGLYPDRAALEAHVTDQAKVGDGTLARVMRKALECADDVRMLSVRDQWVPGYGEDAVVSLQVLAPIPEDVDGAPAYRVFGRQGQQKGPTKNGHSVVIKLRMGQVTMILGGDLNIPAEDYLLDHYAGDRARPDFLDGARRVFRADVAKACHHGSADLSIDFLKAVDALATIVSSGDDEPHCHPRPDALGAFGRHGRGERPLIFSTELARSAPETIKDPAAIRTRVAELVALLSAADDEEQRKKLASEIDAAVDLDRSVAVYGMINVRTDGEKVIIAQKLEQPRSFTGEKWDIHKLVPGEHGLEYDSKH
jgi:beta-lactamase superfamily II metal-dependent hydrolase